MNGKQLGRLRDGTIVKAGDVPGFYCRKRGSRLTWLLRYRHANQQREYAFGHHDGHADEAVALLVKGAMGGADIEATLIEQATGAHFPLTPRQALAVARRLRSRIEAGHDLVAEQRQRRIEAAEQRARSFEDFAERWLAQHLAHKRSIRDTPAILRTHVYPRLGARPIESIKRRDVHAVADALLAEGKVALAARAVRIVRAVLGWLVQRGELEYNVASNIKLSRTPQARDRVLSEGELRTLWAAAGELPSPHGAFLRVLMLTGQRRGEVAEMLWDELREDGLLVIPRERYKSSRAHEVPLSRQARALIEALPRRSEYVFAGRGGKAIGDFSGLKARLPALDAPWTFHDIRRSVITHMNELGLALPHIVEAVAGHALPGVQGIYNRAAHREEKARALQSWADWLAADGEPEANVVPLRAVGLTHKSLGAGATHV